MKRRTLYVKEVTREELSKKWDFNVSISLNNSRSEPLYIRCTKSGKVNWEMAPIYTAQQLASWDRVKILK